MTDLGWIVLQVQKMSEDMTVPAKKRARARQWYQHLTMADAASATPVITQSGGRRRSHNAKRQYATDMEFHGPYRRTMIET